MLGVGEGLITRHPLASPALLCEWVMRCGLRATGPEAPTVISDKEVPHIARELAAGNAGPPTLRREVVTMFHHTLCTYSVLSCSL